MSKFIVDEDAQSELNSVMTASQVLQCNPQDFPQSTNKTVCLTLKTKQIRSFKTKANYFAHMKTFHGVALKDDDTAMDVDVKKAPQKALKKVAKKVPVITKKMFYVYEDVSESSSSSESSSDSSSSEEEDKRRPVRVTRSSVKKPSAKKTTTKDSDEERIKKEVKARMEKLKIKKEKEKELAKQKENEKKIKSKAKADIKKLKSKSVKKPAVEESDEDVDYLSDELEEMGV